MKNYKGVIDQYKEFLPVTEHTPIETLYEGNTPLYYLEKLSEALNIKLYGKFEGLNPTGSFKDRGMVLAVAKAKENGAHTVICASTGNTSASAAAYAAKFGLNAIVLIPKGKIARGKLAQSLIYGAKTVEIEGNFDEALKIVIKIAQEDDRIALVNSINPYRIECQKTAAFEIVDELSIAPDILSIPIGNAGNITAYWKGFKEYHETYNCGLPKMYGFEAEGAAAIAQNSVFKKPETVGTAIRIGDPVNREKAIKVKNESEGLIDYVTDEEIIYAYKKVASTEGIFIEPSSAASLAGVIKCIESGQIVPGSKVVTVFTGNGLKDPDIAIEYSNIKSVTLPNDIKKIQSYINQIHE